MRRKICLMLIAIMIAAVIPAAALAGQSPKVMVNGEAVSFARDPYIENGRLIVSTDGFIEKLGASVRLEKEKNVVWLEGQYASIEFTLGSKTAYIHRKYDFSGIPQKVDLDVAPKLAGNNLFLPLRFIAETLDIKVDWDGKKRWAIIDMKESTITPVERPAAYKVITPADIQNNKKLVQWYEKNYKTQGIHSITVNGVTYVLASAGEKPTGGYTMEISNVTMVAPGSIDASAVVKAPAPDMMVTQALTYPHVLIRMEEEGIEKVSGSIAESDKEIIGDTEAAVAEEDVKSIQLFNLDGKKLKDYTWKEFGGVVGAYNKSSISDDMMIMMLAGNRMVVTLKDGREINLTSYGSDTRIVANVRLGDKQTTYHLICPEIAAILLG